MAPLYFYKICFPKSACFERQGEASCKKEKEKGKDKSK